MEHLFHPWPKRQKYFLKLLISIAFDHWKKIGRNCHAETLPLWWLRILLRFNQLVKYADNKRRSYLDKNIVTEDIGHISRGFITDEGVMMS
jgi:hypothetical protein